jgi:hypothetical protein
VVEISNVLPDVINFYPVIKETTTDISPIENAITKVNDRLEQVKHIYAKIERTQRVEENDKSIIQGTVDAGVNGGLPKYKV